MTLTYGTLTDEVGQELGPGRWIEVDQARIDGFATVTEDHQWIHVDPSRAATGPFGTTIGHGYLTLSLIAPVLEELMLVDGVAFGVNYGLNRVRFPAPVPSGARIRGHAQLLEVEPAAGGLQVVVRVTMELEGSPKPVCVAEVVLRYQR